MEKPEHHESGRDIRLTHPTNHPDMKPINLTLSKPFDRVAPCGSRFWGNPDLPKEYGYPSYPDEDGDPFEYQFVCQINLAEVAPYDTGNRLPHKGLLSFFAKIDHYLGRFDGGSTIGGYIGDTDDVKVLFFPEVGLPGDNPGFKELILLDEDDKPLNPEELQIRFTTEPGEIYRDDHALFAEPTHREWKTWDSPYEAWQILLQVDSFSGMDFNLNFMDCGVLDFLISPDDLAAGRFDRVRAIVLST